MRISLRTRPRPREAYAWMDSNTVVLPMLFLPRISETRPRREIVRSLMPRNPSIERFGKRTGEAALISSPLCHRFYGYTWPAYQGKPQTDCIWSAAARLALLSLPGALALDPARLVRRAQPQWPRSAVLPRVGAPRDPALDHGQTDRALPCATTTPNDRSKIMAPSRSCWSSSTTSSPPTTTRVSPARRWSTRTSTCRCLFRTVSSWSPLGLLDVHGARWTPFVQQQRSMQQAECHGCRCR